MAFTQTDPEYLKKMQRVLQAIAIHIHNQMPPGARTDPRVKLVTKFKLNSKGSGGIQNVLYWLENKDDSKPTQCSDSRNYLNYHRTGTSTDGRGDLVIQYLRDCPEFSKVPGKTAELRGESISVPDEAALDHADTILERDLGIQRGYRSYQIEIKGTATVYKTYYFSANSEEEARTLALAKAKEELEIENASFMIDDAKISDLRVAEVEED